MKTAFRHSRRSEFVLAVAGLTGLMALAIADPATSPLFPPCAWRWATGWLCPGCGSARALHALLHGDVGSALRLNPLAVAAVPLVGAEIFAGLRDDRRWTTHSVRPAYLYMLALAIVLFGILRNVRTFQIAV